jgi:hypothetical protein
MTYKHRSGDDRGRINTFQNRGNFLRPHPFSEQKTSLPSVGRTVRACVLSRLQPPWPSHNFRNTSPCLVGWLPSPKGPLPPLAPVVHSLAFLRFAQSSACSLLRRSHYGVSCEVMVGAPSFVISLLRRLDKKWASLQESRQPARSSAPPSGPRHRDRASPLPVRRSFSEGGCRPATFHTTLRPGSGLSLVPRLSPPQPTHQQRRDKEAPRVPFLAGSEFSFSLCRRAVTASTRNFSATDRYSC